MPSGTDMLPCDVLGSILGWKGGGDGGNVGGGGAEEHESQAGIIHTLLPGWNDGFGAEPETDSQVPGDLQRL